MGDILLELSVGGYFRALKGLNTKSTLKALWIGFLFRRLGRITLIPVRTITGLAVSQRLLPYI